MSQTERLLQIKDQIDEAKTKQAGIKGQISGVEDQMQSKFKVDGVTTAEKKLKKMGEDLDAMGIGFTERMEKLEEAHDWD